MTIILPGRKRISTCDLSLNCAHPSPQFSFFSYGETKFNTEVHKPSRLTRKKNIMFQHHFNAKFIFQPSPGSKPWNVCLLPIQLIDVNYILLNVKRKHFIKKTPVVKNSTPGTKINYKGF